MIQTQEQLAELLPQVEAAESVALDTEAGMVVGLADDDVPSGYGLFRIQSWALNRDWSVDITARTVTPSMYELTAGPVPGMVPERAQPIPAILPGQGAVDTFTINEG